MIRNRKKKRKNAKFCVKTLLLRWTNAEQCMLSGIFFTNKITFFKIKIRRKIAKKNTKFRVKTVSVGGMLSNVVWYRSSTCDLLGSAFMQLKILFNVFSSRKKITFFKIMRRGKKSQKKHTKFRVKTLRICWRNVEQCCLG